MLQTCCGKHRPAGATDFSMNAAGLLGPVAMALYPSSARWSSRSMRARASRDDRRAEAAAARAGRRPSRLRWRRGRGLDFPSPVGLAAGFDKDAEVPDADARPRLRLRRGRHADAAPQAGNPRPRLFRLVEDRAVINRLGFNNRGQAAALQRLQQRDRRRGRRRQYRRQQGQRRPHRRLCRGRPRDGAGRAII